MGVGQKPLGALVQRAVSIGLIGTALLFILELGHPASGPRAVAMPGWIAVILMCGFEGCGDSVLPWVAFGIVNFVAYSALGFAILIIIQAILQLKETKNDN
jgi:hypothetical protein